MTHKRVVITGLGVISSIGSGKKDFWDALISGKSGISKITSFDTSEFNKHLGGEIKFFQPLDYMPSETVNNSGRTSQLAIAAAKLSIEDSNLDMDILDPDRIGVILGTTIGEGQVASEINRAWIKNGINAIPKNIISQYPYWEISRKVAFEFGFGGPNLMIPTACAAGNYAIARAYDFINFGLADIILAGGSDSFSYSAFLGFNRLMSMSPDLIQPFDRNRKGMMIGEGSAILVIESLESALKREAQIIAEIIGYGLSCDAYHITIPHPNGDGAVLAMESALKMARIQPEDINYISAHGTGTPQNDLSETIAIKRIFKESAKKIPISSIKSMLGHCMGAASAIEAVACCMMIHDKIIPPTINYETPDPECDLDYVPNSAREKEVIIAMSNAFAFGGNNACLLIKKYVD